MVVSLEPREMVVTGLPGAVLLSGQCLSPWAVELGYLSSNPISITYELSKFLNFSYLIFPVYKMVILSELNNLG